MTTNNTFKKQDRCGRRFVRGFVTKAVYNDGAEIAVMAPSRSALRQFWSREWPYKPFDPQLVKPYIVSGSIPRKRKNDQS